MSEPDYDPYVPAFKEAQSLYPEAAAGKLIASLFHSFRIEQNENGEGVFLSCNEGKGRWKIEDYHIARAVNYFLEPLLNDPEYYLPEDKKDAIRAFCYKTENVPLIRLQMIATGNTEFPLVFDEDWPEDLLASM